jgi:hypothetical protein
MGIDESENRNAQMREGKATGGSKYPTDDGVQA